MLFLDFYKERLGNYIDITKAEGPEFVLDTDTLIDSFYTIKHKGENIDFGFSIVVTKDSPKSGNPYNLIPDENVKNPVIYFSCH